VIVDLSTPQSGGGVRRLIEILCKAAASYGVSPSMHSPEEPRWTWDEITVEATGDAPHVIVHMRPPNVYTATEAVLVRFAQARQGVTVEIDTAALPKG
jgi:hypothetical protein